MVQTHRKRPVMDNNSQRLCTRLRHRRRGTSKEIKPEQPHKRFSHRARGFPQHCLPAALRHRGGAGFEVGEHEVLGFVPVRGIS